MKDVVKMYSPREKIVDKSTHASDAKSVLCVRKQVVGTKKLADS